MTISRPSGQELFVASAVLLFHILAGAFLIVASNRKKPNEATEEAIIVRWIKYTPTSKAPPAITQNTNAVISPHQGHNNKSKEFESANAPPEKQNTTRKPLQLALSAPVPPISFERDLFSKKERLEATSTHMKVRIVDRSFFGTLQRMTKAQNCKELRLALTKTTGAATTILETMKQEGCFRS